MRHEERQSGIRMFVQDIEMTLTLSAQKARFSGWLDGY